MEEGGNLQDHLSIFQNCVANLLKVDVKYKDDDKALLLLRSLPPSFKHFRTTIMFGKESLKLDEVMEAIQSYVKMDEIPKALKHIVCMLKANRGVGRRVGMINLATEVDQNPKEKRKRTRVTLHVMLLTIRKRIARYGKKGKRRAEKLNGDNYEMWHWKVQLILEEQKALETTNTMVEPPISSTDQYMRDMQTY
ncbi:hypothetical protein LWI28_001944 [Acer negundo]|uniref:Retrovirus-related Pol polyprotein from transposon TNT 1-94 n=1 Tax=Acer negundo TaxID=4023 RepID=A0AAD5NE58_ACENE|nr:hypothetical protein LWI28_001944 [Acer negundo]